MKKLYSAPDAELLCFLPCERLATGGIEWNAGGIKTMDNSPSDVDVPIPSNPEGDM